MIPLCNFVQKIVMFEYDDQKPKIFKICVYRNVRGVFLHKLISGHNFRSLWLLRYKGFTAHPYAALLFLPMRGFSRLMQTTVIVNCPMEKQICFRFILPSSYHCFCGFLLPVTVDAAVHIV